MNSVKVACHISGTALTWSTRAFPHFSYERFCSEWSSRGNTVRETHTTLLHDDLCQVRHINQPFRLIHGISYGIGYPIWK